MKYISAKTIISHVKKPDMWFGNQFNMNIYRGCSHGCIYCDSRSDCYRVENFGEVAAKENALAIIERELKGKRKKGVVGTGAMSDPYNPMEKEHRLTRGAMELIHKYGFGIHIVTKSDLVVRDIDLLNAISSHSPAAVGITITAAEDSLSGKIEPGAPASSERFSAIKKLTDSNIYAGILMMPILPFILDSEENILAIVEKAAEAGAKYICPAFGMTLRQGQREYFYRALDRLYPGLKGKYTAIFGDSYQCSSPGHKKLWEFFRRGCERHGIVYKMPDIIKGIRGSVRMDQISLF